jgi:phage baseplate assembly protein W
MSSLAIKLPLIRDDADGFKTIKSFRTLIKQNLKMLILTNTGERVMIPNYGVGINKFLFQNWSDSTFASIETEILEQVAVYMPVVSITEMSFIPNAASPNALIIKIHYTIPDIGVKDLLEFTI